jgi:hypothetical protein
VSQILHDTTITIEANKNVTLMLVGSRAAGGKVSFVMIDDNPGTVASNQIATRLVNASSTGQTPATASAYITADTTSALPATPTFASVAPRSASPYVLRPTGSFFLRTTADGSTATVWSAVAPAGAPADGLTGVTAGALGGGSAFSGYLFPRSVAGSGAPNFTSPGIVYFVDLIPAPPK